VNLAKPKTVLTALQGSGGGIGRIELLLDAAWRHPLLAERVRVATQHKAIHPSYLGGRLPASRTRPRRAAFAGRVLRTAFKLKPDLILLGHLNFCPLVLPLRAASPKSRIAVVLYGVEAWTRPTRPVKIGLKLVDEAWSISVFTSDCFSSVSGFPQHRIKEFRLGLTPWQYEMLTSLGQVERGPGTILTVSRLEPGQKGVDNLIRALHLLTPSLPEASLSIAGDGLDRPRLEALADQLGVAKKVHFLGWKSFDQLARLYREHEVFALPSKQEGFGLVYIEAMAAQAPIVAARAGAAPEVVEEDRSGLLVAYGDPRGLADTMIKLLRDEALRRRLGFTGLATVRQRYLMEHVSASLESLLWGELS
jgi:glycosyltransferase involved in cell wall biosynthesis